VFIKGYSKYNKTTQERYMIYKLCESYRISGNIHHHIIIGLGKLEELQTAEAKKLLAIRIEELIKGGGNILITGIENLMVEKLAHHFYTEIKSKKRYDLDTFKGEWETVNLTTLKNKDARE
jgi:hypothetical protein